MMFLSMFMYRFLPVPATLLEGIPVSYGMQLPIKTFLLEMMLFFVSSLAFYFATLNSCNNIIQKTFKNIGFYKIMNRKALWIIGICGCAARIITFSMGSIEIGNILGKSLMAFINFMYIPMILFFPGFCNGKYEQKPNFKQPIIWVYLIFISILNLASNSRESLIEPVAMIGLLYLVYLCINNVNVKQIITPKRLIPIVVMFFISLNILTTASDAMLSIRDNRAEFSFTELINLTFDRIVDSKSNENDYSYKKNLEEISYEAGWTEIYLSNFILNRYANIRITDETLYLGEYISQNNNTDIMIDDFISRIVLNLPQPIIDILGFHIDKNNYQFSRGDVLYVCSGIGNSYNLGGYRVTSHIGDGFATFGFLYLPIQFIVFFIVFKLLNCYSYRDKNNKVIYSIYGLFSLYTCLNMFRNANGMIGEINFIARNYWQEILLFMIIYTFANFVSKIRIK